MDEKKNRNKEELLELKLRYTKARKRITEEKLPRSDRKPIRQSIEVVDVNFTSQNPVLSEKIEKSKKRMIERARAEKV
ncbi:hypothetical protein K0M31_007511 [Melipona bicolor]|uniref:Uncharacterized protein n=1 Tax=Melipona bicolor TaxID=60889 RepID=A0AA40KVR0_9HYME|nr:hypothetical protein K0M31_007511 [Melipona bicolor]